MLGAAAELFTEKSPKGNQNRMEWRQQHFDNVEKVIPIVPLALERQPTLRIETIE